MTHATAPEVAPAVPTWTFADRLRKARTTAGYDQKTFAAVLGVKVPTYSAYESGRGITPRYRDIGAFADRVEQTTGVPAWWLLGVTPPDDRPVAAVTDLRPVADIIHAHTADAAGGDAVVTSIASKVRR